MNGLAEFRDALAAPPPRAVLVELTAADVPAFRALCHEHGITLLDTIERQLAEVRNRGQGETGDLAAYGSWVYLPWERRIVHVLPEEDFFAVVTDRNHDKITRAEQEILRGKCVAVVGLSVGGEAAVSLAQEHLCGHLKVADFDELDLSNLNRLNAGVDDLGVPKAWIAARKIAKIDPYLRVSVFEHGVTAANADDFLDGVDLLVEECDDLAVKYDLRVRAKARGIDVVYAADERGFLSVEPYRTHPDLPVFHGIARPEPVSGQDRLRALTGWLGGWDHISSRSRDSIGRVGRSLSGYPQLAGEARFAAGQLAHVARRLLLDEPVAPFHGRVDLAELLAP